MDIEHIDNDGEGSLHGEEIPEQRSSLPEILIEEVPIERYNYFLSLYHLILILYNYLIAKVITCRSFFFSVPLTTQCDVVLEHDIIKKEFSTNKTRKIANAFISRFLKKPQINLKHSISVPAIPTLSGKEQLLLMKLQQLPTI